LVDRLVAARGIAADGRDQFLNPSLTDLERPWERIEYVAAADAILAAAAVRRSIVIYGDYDVDGITSMAILWHVLRVIAPEAPLRTYVPHRMAEGYGLNGEAIELFAREGVTLVITVDCGVTAVAEAERARELGVELIITDHHRPREDGRLPDVPNIVHPSLPGREHRFPEVCGAVVAWKLAWAILDRHAGSPENHRLPAVLRDLLSSLLPLAAIGTVADVMPLMGENRAIVSRGLRGISNTGNEGLNALLTLVDVGKHIDSETIGFRLAPRLNAVGRLGSAEAAVRLLTTATGRECHEIVRELDLLNEERRRTERAIFTEAMAMVKERGFDGDDHRAIVLASPNWHAGVVGIVCSRLVDVFARPTILMQQMDGICKGSGRSIHGFSLMDAIQACGERPLKSGGHAHAAGLTIASDRCEAFTRAFIDYATSKLAVEDLVAAITVDATAEIGELDLKSVMACESLAPFGRGNPRPTVRLDDVVITAPPRLMGKDGRHLMMHLRHADHSPPAGAGAQTFIKAKWWSGRDYLPRLTPGVPLDVVVEPKIDRYLGNESVEVEIRDARLH